MVRLLRCLPTNICLVLKPKENKENPLAGGSAFKSWVKDSVALTETTVWEAQNRWLMLRRVVLPPTTTEISAMHEFQDRVYVLLEPRSWLDFAALSKISHISVSLLSIVQAKTTIISSCAVRILGACSY